MNADTKPSRERIACLIDLADRILATRQTDDGTIPRQRVNAELFAEFRSASLSFILKRVGDQHPFYTEFDQHVRQENPKHVERGRGILKSVKAEIDLGFI